MTSRYQTVVAVTKSGQDSTRKAERVSDSPTLTKAVLLNDSRRRRLVPRSACAPARGVGRTGAWDQRLVKVELARRA